MSQHDEAGHVAPSRARRIHPGLVDALVIGACAVAFVAVIGFGKTFHTKPPPFALIASELGTTPDRLREVSEAILPPPPVRPTETQRRQVAVALNVSLEQLDAVMDKYRPLRHVIQ
jgi:hypothetical protein